MGRQALADNILEVCGLEGIRASAYPDTSGDTVVSIDPVDPIPGKDVIYTVDLCHQTVAAVRSVTDP